MSGGRLKGRSPLKGAGLLEEFEKDRIKASVDIVSLIRSAGISLEKRGSSWMGLCPFHEEKTPSLSVDREKGLFHCFGCGAGGDVFDFVMRHQGVEFKDALSLLKENSSVPAEKPLKTKKAEPSKSHPGPRAEQHPQAAAGSPLERSPIPEEIPLMGLEDVTAYYHRQLATHDQAMGYLKKRGLDSPALLGRLKVGYCPGDLKDKLSKSQYETFRRTGLFTEKGFEAFRNCIVFPLFDPHENVVGFYGRKMSGRSQTKHLYLKGPHKGLFNPKAFKVYPERMILTESVIDALSLMVLGLENVSCIYGTNGVTGPLLDILKDNRTKEVVLAFDNDDAGMRAASRVSETLGEKGFPTRPLFPTAQKDWNDSLLAGVTKQEVLDRMEQAPLQSPAPAGNEKALVPQDNSYLYTSGNLTYRIIGVKEGILSSLKVNLRCWKTEEESLRFIDNADLFSARSRSLYSSAAARRFGEETARVEKDLLDILDLLEAESEAALSSSSSRKQTLCPEEEAAGLSLLTDPTLFDRIIEDAETLGYVGEEENKILMYLAASSRLMNDPVSVIVISQSAAGKSFLIDTVRKMMPEEDVVALTSLSDQALNYLPDEALLHKFLIMGEVVHSDVVDHQLREMMSGKELARLVTVKDEKTGKMTSRLIRKKVIVSAVMSSTSTQINPENASRCFVVNTDESEDQTKAIHKRQREKYSLETYRRKEEQAPRIIRTHRAAQRLLQPRVIVNPFAGALDFPSSLMRSRRDHERFVDLIACVCFLRQYQKQEKDEKGKRYIECDLEDYKVAYRIMKRILSSTMTTLPRSAVLLYEQLKGIIKAKAEKDGLFVTDIWVTQREIRETSGLSHDLVKKNIRLLAEYEYVKVKGAGRGMTRRYSLASDSDLVLFDESAIPSPDRLGYRGQAGPEKR